MDRLPTELLHQIVNEVTGALDEQEVNVLTSLACVSKLWKSIVEPFIWREIELDFDELDMFHRCFRDSHRRKSLRVLCLQLNGYFDCTSDDSGDSYDSSVEDQESSGEEDERYNHSEGTDSSETLEARVREARSDHHRLFSEIQTVWDELYSWDEALKLDSLKVHIEGECLYNFLGPSMRYPAEFRAHIMTDNWLRSYPNLPFTKLASVKSLTVTASEAIDIWPAIVGCIIAETLPNLEELSLFSSDWEKTWTHLRSELRDVLAHHLQNLSRKPFRAFELHLPFKYSINHEVHPPSLLCNGMDTLSRSLNTLLNGLVTLSVNVNQLTPTFFWNPSIKTPTVLYPNLRSLHVDTGFETASGHYIMRSPDSSLFSRPPHGNPEDEDMYEENSDPVLGFPRPDFLLDYEVGDHITAILRTRPKPAYFDSLAISIAQAVTHMPRLQNITIEFVSHFTDRGQWTGYHGWGFAFRAGPDARYPEAHTRAWCGYPGLDMYILDRPHREWTFRCELHQLDWEEPDEAKRLWEERFPGISADIICFDFDEDGEDCWQGVQSDVFIYPEEMEADE